jgi:NAD(P)-dependent dehydrogenase (short-subunit alcohol dehydrogenase family)
MAFRGKVALVTGGGSGMGQRLCERMAAEGALVAALDVNEAGLSKTAATSDRITTFPVDVTDTDAVNQVVEKVTTDLGPIDRTVAAAGIMPSDALAVQDTALIKKVMDVNYVGVVNTVKATLPAMLERRSGDMVVFSSLMGHEPQMYLGAYCASKFAVKAFAEVLWQENYDSGIRFACVCPPAVKTPLVDQLKDDARGFLDYLPDFTQLTPDRVIDAIEKDLEKGNFWVMPGIAKPAAWYYRFLPGLMWKGARKLDVQLNG